MDLATLHLPTEPTVGLISISSFVVMVGLKVLNGATIDGSVVRVRPNCTTDYNSLTSIFIKHVTEGTTIIDFMPTISKFGTVLSAYVTVKRVTNIDPL